MKLDTRYNDIKQTLDSILNYPKQEKFAFNLNKIHDLVFAICQDLYSAKWKQKQAQHERNKWFNKYGRLVAKLKKHGTDVSIEEQVIFDYAKENSLMPNRDIKQEARDE